MDAQIAKHIHDLPSPPVLDVLGKWVHCRNAKVATTSMDEGPLKHRSIIERRGRSNWECVWRQIIVPRLDDIVLFTFVRNPWDRIASAFFHCRDRVRSEENKLDKHWEFGDWIRQVLQVQGPSVNRHFAPQYDTFCYADQTIPGMFVGRFERLQEDWSILAKQLGVSSQLPKWNSGDQRAYSAHYDAETRDIVAHIYAKEIDALGYTFA